MVTFFTFLGFTVLIVFLSRVTERVRRDEDGGDTLTVLDSVTIVHGAICQQGECGRRAIRPDPYFYTPNDANGL